MDDPASCALHEAAIVVGVHDSETLLALARSPIADECQVCTICRIARQYVEATLAEGAGAHLGPAESSATLRVQLADAVDAVKAAHHWPHERT